MDGRGSHPYGSGVTMTFMQIPRDDRRPETPAEREERVRQEAAIIAAARADVAAGNGIEDNALEAWLDSLDQNEDAPIPTPSSPCRTDARLSGAPGRDVRSGGNGAARRPPLAHAARLRTGWACPAGRASWIRLRDARKQLCALPYSGPASADHPGCRALVVEGYLIVYELDPDTGDSETAGDVTVLAVFPPGAGDRTLR